MGWMNKFKLLCFTILLGFIVGTVGTADGPGAFLAKTGLPDYDMNTPYADGYVLVQASASQDGSVASLADANAAIGAEVIRDYESVGISGLSLVKLPDTISVTDAVAYYTGIPGIAYAEPDYYFSTYTTPDDPDLWRQWGLLNTGAPYRESKPPGTAGADISAVSGWDIATSTDDVIIAVIDTGVDVSHPDLTSNLWSTGAYGTVIHGYNVLESDESIEPWDDNGHGTHCAGIIGMIGDNGIGGSGVAWNTSIMAIKALNYRGSGRLSDLSLGMAYASANGASIISCSFGTPYRSRVMEDMIRSSPALFVCAAGNSKSDMNLHPDYPASYDLSNVITVAATDPSDGLSSFSNYGNRTVHVAAPGTEIYSTYPSAYSYDSFFRDPEFSPDNFILDGNWTFVPGCMPGELPSLYGSIPEYTEEAEELVITFNQSVMVPEQAPILVWDLSGRFYGYQRIEYSYDGEHWTILQDGSMYLNEDDWVQKFAPLYSIPGQNSIRIRFTYSLFSNDCLADFSIRNIRLGYQGSIEKPEYRYMNGTSMATPMVAGIAGLIKSMAPELTAGEMRQVIMDTVDPLPSLQDKIISNGRVNLAKALHSLQDPDEIPLYSGWNHVSVPRRLAEGSDTAEIFSDVNSSGHSILRYTDDTIGYQTLKATDPIVPLQGYWLFSDNATTVPIRFHEQLLPESRNISAGWSSVGGWVPEDLSANETFHTLMTGWSYAVGYNAGIQQYEEPIIRGGTGNQSDSRPIHPYQGYWLYCTQNGTYQSGFG